MNISYRHLFAVFALGIVVACAPPAPRATTAPTVPSSAAPATIIPAHPPTLALTPTPQPLKMKVQADEKLAASAVISTTGGTLTATGADGAQFTLTVPKDALLEETKITLTPVTTMEGLPFSGALVGAVQMSPEGLRFFQPVTLTIESPNVGAAKGFETVGFGFHASGDGLYLNPSQAKGNALMLTVLHFSGAGATQGTDAEIQAQYQQMPANAEDALTQRVAEYLEQEHLRQSQGQPTDPEFATKMLAYFREYFAQSIQPQLATIQQDCKAGESARLQALGWARQVEIMGMGDEFQSEIQQINDALIDGLVNCYNKEYDQCVVDNDIIHRTTMLVYARQAALLGIDDRLDLSKIWKCPRRSYRVDTNVRDLHIWGTVCSLDKPFKLDMTVEGVDVHFSYTFTPSSNVAGKVQGEGSSSDGIVWSGLTGNYTVDGTDGASVIHWTLIGGTVTGYGLTAGIGGGAAELPLQPLDPPCDQ